MTQRLSSDYGAFPKAISFLEWNITPQIMLESGYRPVGKAGYAVAGIIGRRPARGAMAQVELANTRGLDYDGIVVYTGPHVGGQTAFTTQAFKKIQGPTSRIGYAFDEPGYGIGMTLEHVELNKQFPPSRIDLPDFEGFDYNGEHWIVPISLWPFELSPRPEAVYRLISHDAQGDVFVVGRDRHKRFSEDYFSKVYVSNVEGYFATQMRNYFKQLVALYERLPQGGLIYVANYSGSGMETPKPLVQLHIDERLTMLAKGNENKEWWTPVVYRKV